VKPIPRSRFFRATHANSGCRGHPCQLAGLAGGGRRASRPLPVPGRSRGLRAQRPALLQSTGLRKNTHAAVRGQTTTTAWRQNVSSSTARSASSTLTTVTRGPDARAPGAGRRALPRPVCRSTRMLSIENTRFLLAHASPRDPLDEYAPADPDFWGRRLQNVDADVICVGHTHQPLRTGSGGETGGQSRQRRPAARRRPPAPPTPLSQDYKVELKRMAYPVEETIAGDPGEFAERPRQGNAGRGVPARSVRAEQWAKDGVTDRPEGRGGLTRRPSEHDNEAIDRTMGLLLWSSRWGRASQPPRATVPAGCPADNCVRGCWR